MITQSNGLAVTTDNPAIAASIDRLEADLLRYSKGVAGFLDGPAAHGDSALGVALAAAIHLFAMTAPSRARARPIVERARQLAANATAREQIMVSAISAWLDGNIERAKELHMAMLETWPADLLSAKICHFHQLNTGDFAAMRRSTSALRLALPDNGFVRGMHAFALEQTGSLVAAEREGRKAAAMNADPWAHHAVAHVLDTKDRAEEGRVWMALNGSVWDDCSSFLYTHNWWHAALFDIALGDHGAALALFDRRIWGIKRDSCQDQINAVSLLVRFELLGVDVGDRWADLAPHLEQRIDDRANAFVDLHYAYGLARAGRDDAVSRQLAALRGLAAGDVDHARQWFHEAVANAAEGMVAHARGEPARAAGLLDSVRDVTVCFGGSRTQRRLIDLVAEDSARRSGYSDAKLRAAR